MASSVNYTYGSGIAVRITPGSVCSGREDAATMAAKRDLLSFHSRYLQAGKIITVDFKSLYTLKISNKHNV